MATATLTPIGSTRRFEVVHTHPNISSNLTYERKLLNNVAEVNTFIQDASAPGYERFYMQSKPKGFVANYITSHPQSLHHECVTVMKNNQRKKDWNSLSSELERIAKLGYDWDGEGAEAITSDSVITVLTLLKIGQEVKRNIEIENESFNRFLKSCYWPSQGLTVNDLLTQEQKPQILSGLTGDPWDAFRQEISTETSPSLYPSVEGGITLKWIHRGKELQCTAFGDTVEVIRWKSSDAYDSDGLWDMKVEQTREHFEWLLR